VDFVAAERDLDLAIDFDLIMRRGRRRRRVVSLSATAAAAVAAAAIISVSMAVSGSLGGSKVQTVTTLPTGTPASALDDTPQLVLQSGSANGHTIEDDVVIHNADTTLPLTVTGVRVAQAAAVRLVALEIVSEGGPFAGRFSGSRQLRAPVTVKPDTVQTYGSSSSSSVAASKPFETTRPSRSSATTPTARRRSVRQCHKERAPAGSSNGFASAQGIRLGRSHRHPVHTYHS
jgi:hypothetical protein